MITITVRGTFVQFSTPRADLYVHLSKNLWDIPPSRMRGRTLFVDEATMLRL